MGEGRQLSYLLLSVGGGSPVMGRCPFLTGGIRMSSGVTVYSRKQDARLDL